MQCNSRGLYQRAGSTAQVPIPKLAQKHKHSTNSFMHQCSILRKHKSVDLRKHEVSIIFFN